MEAGRQIQLSSAAPVLFVLVYIFDVGVSLNNDVHVRRQNVGVDGCCNVSAAEWKPAITRIDKENNGITFACWAKQE